MKIGKKICLLLVLLLTVVTLSGCNEKKEEKTVSCEEGSYLVEGECKKATDVKKALISYSCSDGYTLNDTQTECVKTEIQDAKNDTACPDGYTLSNDKCTKIETEEASIYYTCPNGGIGNGTKCVGRSETNAKVTTTCPKGYMLIDAASSKCVSYTTPSYDTNKGSYYCSNKWYVLHVLEDGRMVCWDATITADKITNYTCSSGTLQGDKCVIDVNYDAVRKVDCRPGWSASGDKCVKKTTIKANSYYCDEGYTLKNNKCSKDIKMEPDKKNYCELEDYQLIGTDCVKF